MLKRAPKEYKKRYKLFGVKDEDLDSLQKSFVTEKLRVSHQDPFLSYSKPKPFQLKHNNKKTTAQLVAELRTEHSLMLPEKDIID